MSVLLFLLTLALAVAAWRGRRSGRRDRVARLVVGWLAGAALLRVLLELAESGAAGTATPAVAAAAGVAGLWTWSRIASLALLKPRRRDLFLRAPFALAALVLAISAGGRGTAFRSTLSGEGPAQLVIFLALAAWSYRWRDALTTRQLFATVAGLVAYAGLSLPAWATPAAAAAIPAPAAAFLGLARWTSALALAHAVLAIPPVVVRFVKDPTLGIRTVRWRVALSHTLVVSVPLAIVAGLWILTTFLGAGADRALVARRALASEAEGLQAALDQALGSPGTPEAALEALARSRRGKWPGLRVWSVSSGTARRVSGRSVEGEASLAAWCAGLDSLPASGVVELEGRRWLGAAARAGGTGAVALLPLGEAIAGAPSRITGVPVTMRERAPRIRSGTAPDSAAAAAAARTDSAELERVRRVTRRFGLPDSLVRGDAGTDRDGSRVHITTGGDTLDVGERGNTPGTGEAVVAGITLGPRGWRQGRFALQVHVGMRETLSGLFRNVRENLYNLVPIVILAGLVLLLLPVALFNFRIVSQLGRSVTEPAAALRDGARALGEGRLEHRIEVRGEDELWQTAGAFNRMAEGLERARARELERQKLENELEVARRIQARLLPAGPPAVGGLEISGHSESAREVGGDYYDHLLLPDGRVLLVIADVSGKGVPAALLMSAFRAALLSQDTQRGDPAEVAGRLNEFLHRSVEPGRFVTAFLGFLDPRDGRFTYANAGHNPPAILRADGRVEWLTAGGLILGILSPSSFESGQVVIEPGDLLALYTDGVTEGANAAGELFGEERLVEVLRRRAGEPCAELAGDLVREVREFEGEQGPADDITVLLARRSRA